MRAELVDLDEIVGLPRNPKDHDIGEIDTSISRFGFLERILINETTGHLIAGHGRVEDLIGKRDRGEAPPRNIFVREDGKWYVPADFDSIPIGEEEAAAIALNRLVEKGGWNEGDLAEILGNLAAQGEHMLDGIGFDADDLDEMLKRLGDGWEQDELGDDDLDVDDIGGIADAMQEKWRVEHGDLWQVGDHYVICADSREAGTWERLFDKAKVKQCNGIITSPPYAE